ncbi:tetratricopeptide repeat protein [Pseudemcibacter aquimaris]|uniref:tetratricopeptide repeat protein n=1 Tax=Pseudemcibacter aquimaris TaxID=2857064 RepID=UPI00201124C4|nr:tetratricopeptide repeat protein [Pseudemcibacter aquimaris]MCC3860796.1 tetratricopeptide repeat protein [Pseudemcibacter aquimaris]WDU59616.1 tetratricopeptide repeat protein [Pseudemcibacter aquimaris]
MAKKQTGKLTAPKNRAQYNKQVRMGFKLHKQGKNLEALQYFTSAWKYDDTDAKVSIAVADCLAKNGNKTASMNLLEHVLQKNPDNPNIASILGNTALSLNYFDLALKFHNLHMQLEPGEIVPYNNYATALREAGQLDEAIDFLKDVIPIFPDKDALWNTLGATVGFRDGPGHAIVFYEEALKIDPNNKQVLNNIGPAYYSVGEYKKAEEAGLKALKLDPNQADPKLFLFNFYVKQNQYDKAWDYYKGRKTRLHFNYSLRYHGKPYWNGQDLKDKKILIFAEQGIGDEIQFAWLYNQVIKDAKKVGLSCQDRLVNLFKYSFPNADVGSTVFLLNKKLDYNIYTCPDLEIEEYDYLFMAGDLMGQYWHNKEDIQINNKPTLKPNPEIVDKWQIEIEKLPHDISVGIAWRSGLQYAKRARNYASILDWVPFLKEKNINFVNVQYGDCKDELEELEKETGIKIHQIEGLDLKNDIEGTTAMMTSLDLVMGPASAPLMQSGMAGVESWIFSAGDPWWIFHEEYLPYQTNKRVLFKGINDPWPEFMEEQAPKFQKWLKDKRKEK